MKLLERIKTLVQENKSKQVETIIISKIQCPHCTSRSMFVFKDSTKTQLNSKGNRLKPNVSLSSSKTDHNLK